MAKVEVGGEEGMMIKAWWLQQPQDLQLTTRNYGVKLDNDPTCWRGSLQ